MGGWLPRAWPRTETTEELEQALKHNMTESILEAFVCKQTIDILSEYIEDKHEHDLTVEGCDAEISRLKEKLKNIQGLVDQYAKRINSAEATAQLSKLKALDDRRDKHRGDLKKTEVVARQVSQNNKALKKATTGVRNALHGADEHMFSIPVSHDDVAQEQAADTDLEQQQVHKKASSVLMVES
jgi:hypothetical protein